jgi:hypothetical protein
MEAALQSASFQSSVSEPRIVVHDDRKELLVDRGVIFESVRYLEEQGLDQDEILRCLVHHFYVDLDLLNEALQPH